MLPMRINNYVIDGWAPYFEKLRSPLPTSDHSTILDLYRAASSIPYTEPEWTTSDDILNIIQSLPHNKATGPDHLTNEHLPFADYSLGSILSNAILQSAHILSSFRHGTLIPIPKGENLDLTNPTNFRGTLLSVISKEVFEKFLFLHLSSVTSRFQPLQGGFISRRSPMYTTFILQEAILSIQEKKKAFVAFLDVRKGFNTVWHDSLLYKLCQFGFPNFILHSIYKRAFSSVLWNAVSRVPAPVVWKK